MGGDASFGTPRFWVGLAVCCFSFPSLSMDCLVPYAKAGHAAVHHLKFMNDLKALVQMMTESASHPNSPNIQRLLNVLSLNSPPTLQMTSPMGKVQNQLVEAVTHLTTSDLSGTDASFQRAVNLIKSWDREYPPDLVRERVMGVFAALEDHQLSRQEIKTLNAGIQEAHSAWVKSEKDFTENGTGNPVRSQMRRRVDEGHILAPIDGNAAREFRVPGSKQ